MRDGDPRVSMLVSGQYVSIPSRGSLLWIVAVSVKGPKHDTMSKDRKRCSLRDRRVPIPNSLTASPDRQHSAR